MPQFNATLLIVMLSFVVFMLLMKAWYFDPMLKLKYTREGKLEEDRTSAQRFAEEYERLHAEYEAGLKQARKEAHQVIQEVRQKAKASAQETLAEARGKAQAESEQQMTELKNWRETTYQQLEREREALTQAIIAKITPGQKVRTASGG